MVSPEMREYLMRLKKKTQEWEERLKIAKNLIEAREKAGQPTLAVWNRYHQLYARVQAIREAIEKALKELGVE